MTRESVPHYVGRFYAVLSVTQYADERDFGAIHVFFVAHRMPEDTFQRGHGKKHPV